MGFFCMQYIHDFGLPREELEGHRVQKAQAVAVLHEVIQGVFTLFCAPGSSATWNNTILDILCSRLHWQLSDMEACVKQEVEVKQTPTIQNPSVRAVNKYFRNIHLYLTEKENSPCAWMTVTLEVSRAMSLSTFSQERLSKD
ncbi:interferon alpha-1/13-like [Lepus europaeus]|uniref:interferon alpha-1/13-like n=1 Tax=Lepus europaeus TaxID=9983 RepID=UPI002B47A36D|nr:interferon alpha-1/13-like [Lepus europaeus]